MRALHVISGIDPENGGPTNALLGLAAAQARQGMEVTVAATWQRTSGRENAQTFRERGLSVEMIGPARGALSRHPQIKPVLGRLIASADVVHIHALWEEIQYRAARICQAIGRPYLIRPCGGLHPWAMARGRLKKRLYLALRLRRNLDRAGAIHYTTMAERDALADMQLRPRAIVEPNGIDLREFSKVTRAVGREFLSELLFGAGSTLGVRKLIVFLGRIDPKKGLDILVPAFIDAIRSGAGDALLVLAGPPQDRATVDFVSRSAREAGLADRIFLPGMLSRKQTIQALAGADLFALTSYNENFGIAVVEALAAGCPVIISDRVEIQESLAAAGVGQVIPLDRAATTTALLRWLGDDELRLQAGQRARAFAGEHFDWDQIARRWRAHYEGLIR